MKQAKSGYSIKSTPSGKKMSSLKKVEQEILLFTVQIEHLKILKEEVHSIKAGSKIRKQREKELAQKLKQADSTATSILKKTDDGANAIIGKVG
ncbi:hypothetical protein GTQ34_15825 [Muricauda sp. JGD-17]|uniref:Uncharacterized protein n=1 Tax=Flagellimonas ochracea TaxID=2696472 RepID=A0A964TED9_9FLAO|nr:hypothetical protein [Allomuricauda ochracea]NAY93379.1 hypothetical protein [Allomuricauda ochracea]